MKSLPIGAVTLLDGDGGGEHRHGGGEHRHGAGENLEAGQGHRDSSVLLQA